MQSRATGWLYGRGVVASDAGYAGVVAGASLLLGLLSFLLVPGWVGTGLALVAFVALTCASPLLMLLALLAAIPIHFVLRREAGPVDLSLPDLLLLSAGLGLLVSLYWVALLGDGRLHRVVWRIRRSAYVWPAALFVVLGTASLLLVAPRSAGNRGPDWVVGLRAYSLIVEPLAVYALVLLTLLTRRRLWLALDVLFASAVLASLFGVGEAIYYTLNPTPEIGGYYRAASLFNQPNTLALYLNRTLPLFGAIAVALPGRGRRRWVYTAGTICMALAMLLTLSRGGWLGLAAAALATVVLLRRYRWLIPAAAAGAGAVLFLALTAQRRLLSLVNLNRGSGETRERLWRAAVDEIGDSPVWGSGLGNVRWMRRYMNRQRLESTELVDAHNVFLDFWTRFGFLGIVAIVWLVAQFGLLLRRVLLRGDAEAKAVAVGLGAVMTASFVHGLVDAFYFGLHLAVLFWFMLGVVEALAGESTPATDP